MRFTKTLIGTSVAAAALGLLATAAPAMADAGPLVPYPVASTVAPGTTGAYAVAFQNSGNQTINFNSAVSGAANPSSIVFEAPENTTFPAQATVPDTRSTNGGVTFATGFQVTQGCVVSNGGKTLTCALVIDPTVNGGNANAPMVAGAIRKFTPQVTVDASVAPGTVLNGGSSTINMYNYQGPGTVQMLTASTTQPLLTGTPGPGAPIYNTDGTVDIPGYGTPGATITIKDANGDTIGTATVAADGSYDVKIAAGDAATAAAEGPVKVTESDMPGTTWPVTIDIPQLGTPIINPLVGGGIALATAAGLGTVLLVRRRKAAVQA